MRLFAYNQKHRYDTIHTVYRSQTPFRQVVLIKDGFVCKGIVKINNNMLSSSKKGHNVAWNYHTFVDMQNINKDSCLSVVDVSTTNVSKCMPKVRMSLICL